MFNRPKPPHAPVPSPRGDAYGGVFGAGGTVGLMFRKHPATRA